MNYNIITNTSRSDFLFCPEYYRLRYEVKIVKRGDNIPLLVGSWVHEFLHMIWTGDWSHDTLQVIPDHFEAARASAMIRGYRTRWESWLKDSITDVQSEVAATIPLINPETGYPSTYWRVGLILDKFCLIDEIPHIVEHKTSRDVSDGYFERLILDGQVSSYLFATKLMKLPEPFGVLYDVLGKPQLRPLLATPEDSRKYHKKTGELYANQRLADETPTEYENRCFAAIAEDPNRYYQHHISIRTEEELRRSQLSLWITAATIREHRKLSVWPQNGKSCRNEFGSFCQYWPICSKRESVDGPSYEYKEPHQELLSSNNLKEY